MTANHRSNTIASAVSAAMSEAPAIHRAAVTARGIVTVKGIIEGCSSNSDCFITCFAAMTSSIARSKWR